MKQLVMCLAAVVILVVWAASSREATARSPVPAVELPAPAPVAPGAGFGSCAPGSQGTCTGQVFGTQCGTNPAQFCFPLRPAPGGGEICSCRAS